ncbi:hypothetical protein VTO42DRAFT_261 [Malbranchea cinnamomea]
MPPNHTNPRKRRREAPNVDVKLVEIYEDLANENNEIRLKAAGELLSRFAPEQNPSQEDIEKAIYRLFRGLCSSRKAARIGFSIALTELLTTVFSMPNDKRPSNLDAPKILEILEKLTTPVNAASGQEERDHHFGRLFGAEAILKSAILFESNVPFENWTKLLNLVFELAKKKPWLREECGFIIFTAVSLISSKKADAKYIEEIISSLCQHNLVKTPEGVAIWLAALDSPLKVKLPSGVWQHESPIDVREKATLSKIMRESSEPQSAAENAQNSGVWNPKLHFAWEVILPKLYAQDASTFADIWTEVVDNGLFAFASSEERKFWGFQVFSKVLTEAPQSFASLVFTRNFMRSLMNQLAVEDRYLHKAAVKASKAIQSRVAKDPDFLQPAIRGLLGPNGAVNFDQLTKTKTVEKMLGEATPESILQVIPFISDVITRPGTDDVKVGASTRQQLSGLLHSIVKSLSSANKYTSDGVEKVIERVLLLLAGFAYFVPDASKVGDAKRPEPPITQATQELFRNRISSCLNALIASRKAPASVAYKVIRKIRDLSETSEYGKFVIEMNETISESLTSAFKTLKKISKKEQDKDQKKDSSIEAFKLLYSMTILQVYNGDADAVSMLDELKLCSSKLLGSKKPKPGQEPEAADILVEILLSFASKQSQLFRRTSEQVFGAFTDHITASGLQSMIAVLEAKDSIAGQQELFENADDDDDVEMGDASELDSDVEVVDASDNESESSEEASEDEEDESEEDEELKDFDEKLAAALGTHRADKDAEASEGSDSDMNDDQMEALDEQLAEVFRARAQAANKKKERKNARETMINFKNRVLDLLEIFVRKSHSNPAGLTIILPLLQLIRKTKVAQLATKAANVLREYSRLCKGSAVPKIESDEPIWPLLKAVHQEAMHSGPSSYASACSQASLLLVKILTAYDKEAIRGIVDIYAATRKEQLLSKRCHVQPSFFSDWNNWCVSASKQMKE